MNFFAKTILLGAWTPPSCILDASSSAPRALSMVEMLTFDAENDEPYGNGATASRQLYQSLLPQCLVDGAASSICARAAASSRARHDAKLAVRARGDAYVRFISPIIDAVRHFPKWRPEGLLEDELWASKARRVVRAKEEGAACAGAGVAAAKACPAVCHAMLASAARTNARVNAMAAAGPTAWSVGMPRTSRSLAERHRAFLGQAVLLFVASQLAASLRIAS